MERGRRGSGNTLERESRCFFAFCDYSMSQKRTRTVTISQAVAERGGERPVVETEASELGGSMSYIV